MNNLKIGKYVLDKDFPIVIYNNRKLKCGILAKDMSNGGYLFHKGTPIILDEKGIPNFKGTGIKGFKDQEWVNTTDIYDELGSEASFDDNCIHYIIETKNPVKLMGVTWGRRTTIEFTDQHPSGLIYPRKIFARSLQEIDGQTLKKDSTVLFCWRKKDDQVVIKSIRTSTLDEFNMEDDGGNQCPW